MGLKSKSSYFLLQDYYNTLYKKMEAFLFILLLFYVLLHDIPHLRQQEALQYG